MKCRKPILYSMQRVLKLCNYSVVLLYEGGLSVLYNTKAMSMQVSVLLSLAYCTFDCSWKCFLIAGSSIASKFHVLSTNCGL